VTISVTGTGNDLSVGSIATGQSVTLSVAGAVLDADSGTDTTDISASSLSITAASVGASANALETDVEVLSLTLGAGGAYLNEANGLMVTGDGIQSAGSVNLVSQIGNIDLNAHVQLSGEASLTLQAVTGAITQTERSTVETEAGGISIEGLTGASVARVQSDTGRIEVLATEGPFVVPSDSTGVDYGQQPVRIQGAGVDLGAALAGSGTIEFTLPSQGTHLSTLSVDNAPLVLSAAELNALASALPIVVGDTVGFNSESPVEGEQLGLFIDNAELDRLVDGFDRIVMGSQDPRQQIWLNAPVVNGVTQSLVFRDPLVLVASGTAFDAEGRKLAAGSIHMGGSLQGEGLVILGSGSTTHLTAAQQTHSGNVLISDGLVVHSDSRIEVTQAHGLLEIRGSILVKSGATLSLSASEVRLGAFGTGGGSVVLEAGATLVLGTEHLTVDTALVIDGGGLGHLVLQGVTQNGVVQDFELSVHDLQNLTAQMLDDSFDTIVMGHTGTDTTVMSPSLWSEGAGSVLLVGETVHLGAVGSNATWQMGGDTLFTTDRGDLVLNADLLSSNGSYLVLEANDGQVRMASDASILSDGGLVTLHATTGIEVGQIDTSGNDQLRGAVALDSAQGQIVLAAAYDDALGIRSQSVSMFGYGQLRGDVAAEDRVVRVESDRLQLSAPMGQATRGMNEHGVYYRLMNKANMYSQVQVVGDAPDRVMLSRADTAGKPIQSAVYTASNAQATAGFTQQIQSMALGLSSRSVDADVGMQAQAYLSSYVRPMLSGLSAQQLQERNWISLDTLSQDHLNDDLLLSDLAYGFDEDDEASFVMGLPAVQPISSGLQASSEVLFDYEVA